MRLDWSDRSASGSVERSTDNTFNFDLRVVARIRQKTKSMPCRFQVVVDLSPVLVGQGRYRLQFDHDLAEANQVGHVLVLEPLPFVLKYESRLRRKINILQPSFNLKAFLIHRFEKPTAFLFVESKWPFAIPGRARRRSPDFGETADRKSP